MTFCRSGPRRAWPDIRYRRSVGERREYTNSTVDADNHAGLWQWFWETMRFEDDIPAPVLRQYKGSSEIRHGAAFTQTHGTDTRDTYTLLTIA